MEKKRIRCADDSQVTLELDPQGPRLDVRVDFGDAALTPTTAREAAAYLLEWAEEMKPTR